MHLDLRTRLSMPSLERALNAQHPSQVRRGWAPRLRDEGLTIDLSRVEWIEPGALVMAVLLVEACIRDGFDVVLRTPRRQARANERKLISAAKRSGSPDLLNRVEYVIKQIHRRWRAIESLTFWRLGPALQAEHIVQARGRLHLEQDFDSSAQEGVSADVAEITDPHLRFGPLSGLTQDEITYSSVFPLRWIGNPNAEPHKSELAEIGNHNMLGFLTHVLKLPDRGISVPDARTLAHVLLFELLENVAVHTPLSRGLLAVWARPRISMEQSAFDRIIKQTFLPCQMEFGRWASRFPVIEIVVGDSGPGIPAILGPSFADWAKSKGSQEEIAQRLGSPASVGKHLSKNQQILFWSLDKWSSSVSQSRRRATLGLYRVARMVEKWEGELTIRSETDLIGKDCRIEATQPQFVEVRRLARFPGTVIHIRLPIKRFPESRISVPIAPVRELRFSIVDFDADDDIDASVGKTISAVVERARGLSILGEQRAIIVDVGFRPMNRHQLETLLGELVQVTHPMAVVVANVGDPGAGALDLIADSIGLTGVPADSTGEDIESQDVRRVNNLLLVLERSGKAKWIGHYSSVCSLFDNLVERGELSRDAVLAGLAVAHEGEQRLRDLLDQRHVVDVLPDGGIRIRFSVGDILDRLTKQMADDLSQLIQKGKPPEVYSVPGYVFVTPSQRSVDKYICLDHLLGSSWRRRALGFLALQLRFRLRRQEPGKLTISIVTDERKARGLADSLAEQLGEAEIHPLPGFSRVGRRVGTVFVPRGHQVIVFTDVISTGSLVRGLVTRLLQSNVEPCLVACIVDARSEWSDHITIEGKQFPVLSLAQVDITPDVSALVSARKVWINPVTSMPEPEGAAFDYEIGPEALDHMVMESNAMYSGHIHRSDWRHFTIYLDAMKLLDSGISSIQKEIHDAFRRVVERWRAENGIKRIDQILYPETEDETRRFSSAARTIGEELARSYGLTADRVKVIPRKKGPTRWLFGGPVVDSWDRYAVQPAESSEAHGSRVENAVLVDWGCVTGQTAHKMISVAASLEVKHALVVFFVSQLTREGEQTLRIFKQAGKQSKRTEVTVEFVTRCGTWAYGENECPQCWQRRRFKEEVAALDPPQLLRDFVDEAYDDLELKTLEEIRREEESVVAATVSVPSGQLSFRLQSPTESYIRMARFRELLREAESTNTVRHEIREHIRSLVDRPVTAIESALPTGAELSTLISAEWTLLSRPPLDNSETREHLARIAANVTQDGNLPISVRQSGIIVLRTASDRLFIRHLPHLLTEVLPWPKLTGQLLYCGFTLMKQQTVSERRRLSSIVECLTEASRNVRPSASSPFDGGRLKVLETVNLMYDLSLHLLRTMSTGMLSPVQAWQHLKAGFTPDNRHDAVSAIRALYHPGLEEAIAVGRSLPDMNWGQILKLWKRWEQFLHDRVLTCLPSLQRIVLGKYGRDQLGIRNAEILGDPRQREVLKHLGVIRTRLQGFVQNAQNVRMPGVWQDFGHSRTFLDDLLLGSSDTSLGLHGFLFGCPFVLDELPTLVDEIKDPVALLEVSLTGQLWSERVQIFCHEGALRRCIEEILENIVFRLQFEDKETENLVPVEIHAERVDERVAITVRNQRTNPEIRRSGMGLVLCSEWLEAYEASLRVVDVSPPWTFAVQLTFLEA